MNIIVTSFSFPSIKNNIYDGKFVFSEAMAYARNGANVRVITPHYYTADKIEQIDKKITIIRFPYFIPESRQVLKLPGSPIYNQKSFLAIIQIPLLCFFFALTVLRHARWADMIHAQWTVTALLSLPAKWLFRKKIVLTARGSDLRLLPKWLNRFIHLNVDAAIDCFGPQAWNNEYRKNFPARYVRLPLIVYNDASAEMPTDMTEMIERKPDTFIILYVGRFDYIKIVDNKLPLITLIEAGKILKTSQMNFHVFYVGDGEKSLKTQLSGLIDKFGLHDCVTLLGQKTNVLDYMKFCHIGLGGIAFNAVSQEFTLSGKAQIFVKSEDNKDTPWQHLRNALFVNPDDQNDLAEKLIWAMENPEETKKLGETAKKEMGEYIVDSQVGGKLYLQEFEKIAGNP